MTANRQILLWAGAWALVGFAWTGAGQPLSRPVSGKGADAGTLLVYADGRTAYSLADDLAGLQMQLQRVAMKLESVPAAQADSNKVATADYLVVFCPQHFPAVPKELLQTVAQRTQPVLWIGYGADALEDFEPFSEEFQVSGLTAGESADTVRYRERDWDTTRTGWLPVEFTTNARSRVIMSLPAEPGGGVQRPICWRIGPITFFTALPLTGAIGHLFSDLLLDFFDAKQTPPAALLLRLDAYHCRRDHSEFRRMVDFLYDRGHSFAVGVIPAFWDPAEGKVFELDSQPEFVAALRYAQQRGGRFIMQGYVHAHHGRTGEEPEFWDAESDRPLAENGDYVRERLHQGLRQMLKHGLLPLAWETPQHAASTLAYERIARNFSTATERVQLSDATARQSFAGAAGTLDKFGRFVVPENLGALSSGAKSLERVQARAEMLTRLDGVVACGSFPVYLPLQRLIELTEQLEDLEVPFLDLADGDHWIQLPEAILLTGEAQRTLALRDARVTWKAFNREGNLLAEAPEQSPSSGQRSFKRRGTGDYELFQIVEAIP